mmetsp:Transcript_8988/g.37778  ORF Transcript_8988/g.37778 Transcript_8988/m.37778 type:complete len:278 (+) Transcript_8988:892-1725(+)
MSSPPALGPPARRGGGTPLVPAFALRSPRSIIGSARDVGSAFAVVVASSSRSPSRQSSLRRLRRSPVASPTCLPSSDRRRSRLPGDNARVALASAPGSSVEDAGAMGSRSAETLSGSERRSAEVWSTKETSRRRRAPVSASYRRLALGKYSRLVALRVRGREGGETGAGSAARVVVSSVAAFAFASESDDAFGRGGAVPAEASARRNAEDASVISALPAASMTNARPSARRMITKGLGSGGAESSSVASSVTMFMLVVAPMRTVGVSRALMEVLRRA